MGWVGRRPLLEGSHLTESRGLPQQDLTGEPTSWSHPYIPCVSLPPCSCFPADGMSLPVHLDILLLRLHVDSSDIGCVLLHGTMLRIKALLRENQTG